MHVIANIGGLGPEQVLVALCATIIVVALFILLLLARF